MLINGNEACKLIGTSKSTLRSMSDQGVIRTIRTSGGHRRYCSNSINDYINRHTNIQEPTPDVQETKGRQRIAYARVSSSSQKDDLERQIEFLRCMYPDYRIIHDIGSGLNYKRRGLQTILELAVSGNIQEVVVAHKDRLARFGVELIEWIVCRNGGRVVYYDKEEGRATPEMELTQDLISIITIFSCRIQGRRRYNRLTKHESEGVPNEETTGVVHKDPTWTESIKKRSNTTHKRKTPESVGVEEKNGVGKRQKV